MTGGTDPLPHPFFRAPSVGSVPLISATDLRELRELPDPPVLLDVRSSPERIAGHIEGDRWIPLSELPRRLGELPRGRPIVAYDLFGDGARKAAAFLLDSGRADVAALDGGADEYARLVDPTVGRLSPEEGTGLVLVQLPRPESGCLSYFLGDPIGRRAILVDPGIDVLPYSARLKEGGWTLDAIVETHTHADHLAGHAALHLKTGAPIWLSRRSPAAYTHQGLSAGDSIEAGSLRLEALETPGHTRDHLTLKLGNRIFTGDTLLLGACGRSDLGDGDPEMLWSSLHETLGALGDDVEVYPAHFGPRHALPARYVSTLGFERATNEALLVPTREAFVKYMTEGWPPKPADFERIVAANLADP
jgi:glyoxylase-like metal-dependent hydrolase (beta-lactamase superfamily II)